MADWFKAAESQLLLHRWHSSEQGKHWMRAWTQRVCEGEPEKRRIYETLMLAEEHKLLTAESIWVSPEMCEIVQHARESFQPEPVLAQDFITQTGFVYFEQPLYMSDRHGHTVSMGAMSWCPFVIQEEPQSSGMALAIYSSAHADKDEFSQTHQEYLKQGVPPLMPLLFSIVPFNEGIEGDLYDLDGSYTGADEWWRTMQVALRLMQQRIADRYEERLPRPDRRRLQRAGSAIEDVLVIRLRRPAVKHHEGESEPQEWTHRWMVDGHWRWQPYADGVKRQIWIAPFVKGPEDKPLVIKRRYYKWDA
jgi:hypothetical protein